MDFNFVCACHLTTCFNLQNKFEFIINKYIIHKMDKFEYNNVKEFYLSFYFKESKRL